MEFVKLNVFVFFSALKIFPTYSKYLLDGREQNRIVNVLQFDWLMVVGVLAFSEIRALARLKNADAEVVSDHNETTD